LANKKQPKNTDALNLTKTQNGYVPLHDRFKSFPKDSENAPVTDERFYFDNQANSTLEHADIGLLYPTPDWIRNKKNKADLIGAYRDTPDNFLRVTPDGFYRVTVQEKP
jgi:hypothetical protein